MSELSDATAALTQAATSHGAAKAAFDGYLAKLDEPDALEQMGFKRMRPKRELDDSNPSISYPGGTSIADATVTHTLTYQSAFPDEETELFFMWGCAAQLHSNGYEDEPRAHAGITLPDDTLLTNQVDMGLHITGTETTYLDGVLSASGETTKPAGVANLFFQQRCWMDLGESGCFMKLDNAEMLIWEYVK